MIDVKTGLLIWALEALSLSMLLLALWVGMRRTPTLLLWSAGFAVYGLGLAGVALRGRIPDFLSIQVANTAALFGMGLLLAGIQAFDRRPVSFTIFLPAFVWTGGMLMPEIRDTFWARVVLYQVAAAIGFLFIAATLLRPPRSGLDTRSLLGLFQAGQVAHALVMAALVSLDRPGSFEELENAAAFVAFGALGIVASLILGTRMLMLEKEDDLRRLAETDPLTGVLNRRGLEQAFLRLNAAALPDAPMTALIHLDLDHFKRVNDHYGHPTGDSVLITFARIAAAAVSGRGYAGRLGGEEFACVLRIADAADAVEVAGRIREAMRRTPVRAGRMEIVVSASAGISLAQSPAATLDALLSGSDRARYAAKRAGRDRIGLDCEDRVELISAEDEAAISDTTDGQVAALNHIGLIGRF